MEYIGHLFEHFNTARVAAIPLPSDDRSFVDKYCYVNVRHLPRFFDYSTELTYSKSERVSNIDDIQHPAIRNAMKMLDMHEIRLTYEADLPARSGLGKGWKKILWYSGKIAFGFS